MNTNKHKREIKKIKTKTRKLQTEMTELEILVHKMKNLLEGLNSKETASKDRIIGLQDEVNKIQTRIEDEECLKINEELIREFGDEFKRKI